MPEGPEVTVIREGLNSLLKGHQIYSLEILSTSRFSKKSPDGYNDFIKTLPTRIESVESKGKFIYFKFTNGWTMYNTLGMSGGWYHKNKKHSSLKLRYSSSKKKTDELPKGITLDSLTDKQCQVLYFVDQRRFGTVKFIKTQSELTKKLKTIGPDILNDASLTFEVYKKIMRKHNKKNITKVMLNQSIISGVGNYLKAEILYHCKMSPHVKVEDIPDWKLEELYKASKLKINASYKARGASVRHYSDIEDRKGVFEFQFIVYNQKKDKLGNPVIKEKTPDKRTTHWVPKVQTNDFFK